MWVDILEAGCLSHAIIFSSYEIHVILRTFYSIVITIVNLGVNARVKYGFLLNTFKDRLPIFRTESQESVDMILIYLTRHHSRRWSSLMILFSALPLSRMLKSAQNFAAGFFGIPWVRRRRRTEEFLGQSFSTSGDFLLTYGRSEDQYNLEVTIESRGFNNTLAPYTTVSFH